MNTMQMYLEKDKERFLNNLAKTLNKPAAVKEIRNELDRVLYSYNEQDLSDRVKEAASFMVQSVKPAFAAAEADGEATVFSREEVNGKKAEDKRSVFFGIFLFLGLLASLASLGYIYIAYVQFAKDYYPWILFGGVLLGSLFLLLAGIFSKKKPAKERRQYYAEMHIDSEKIYQSVFATVLVIDKQLEELQIKESIAVKKQFEESGSGVDDSEIELYAQLLESAYADMENPLSQEFVSQLKYFLHKHHIEVVNCTQDTKGYFDFMPSETVATIRPALLLEGTLLKKGLASGGE